MAISLELVDFDKLFRELSHPPMILNDIVESSEAEKETLKNLIFTKYDTDLMKNIPSCDCGTISGTAQLGVYCENCNTCVTDKIDKELEPALWVRTPKGVSKLMNPMVWIQLSNTFRKANFNVIEWICDTTYRVSKSDLHIVKDLQDAGINRGYNYFVDNFHEIIHKLLEIKKISTKSRNYNDLLLRLINDYKDCLFSNYVPVVNRALLVIEDTTTAMYVDPNVPVAINAILTIVSVDSDENRFSQKVRENRTAKFIAGMASYYEKFIKNNAGSKSGIFRQHIYGSRGHFTFRAVVTSITDKHEYDEIHIPWSIAVGVLRYHIINKLRKRNFTDNQAVTFINENSKKYHPLLDEIFQELIDESPRKGIDVTLNRNPSLARGSIQRVRITKVKKDPTINTVSFSILIVSPLNADFDGRVLLSLNFSN